APVLYRNPPSLNQYEVSEKKEKFYAMMVPAILIAKYHTDQKRAKFESIKDRLLQDQTLHPYDSIYLKELLTEYKCKKLQELDLKLITHPVSIVLAQAAVESGWGSSRFFLEANNIFGIWSLNKNEPRIRAVFSRSGYPIYLKKYENLAESIEDYFRTIARVKAYQKFREKRGETDDPFEMVPYLNRYSEQGQVYTRKIANLIRNNDLTRFDQFQVDPEALVKLE
ncbi:MAG: glucosaminidase domain-containing protein, partial [Aurantibacter sp.]